MFRIEDFRSLSQRKITTKSMNFISSTKTDERLHIGSLKMSDSTKHSDDGYFSFILWSNE